MASAIGEISSSNMGCEGSVVSLDVTAMVAYVSNTSNGHANYVFQDKFLTEQAQDERKQSVKEVIEKLWKGLFMPSIEVVFTFHSNSETLM